MEFLSPVEIRVEQNDCVFEGRLQRTKECDYVWLNYSRVKIEKNAKITVLKNFTPPVINTEYKGMYADETHDDLAQMGSIGFYDEHLSYNREF